MSQRASHRYMRMQSLTMPSARFSTGTSTIARLTALPQSEHYFHIPVMGTGFTNTTPLEVAPFGVSSVIALADDTLLEQMRKALSKKFGIEYQPIGPKEDDSRARRTRAYLDLIADEVQRRFEALRTSPFEPGSPIQRYFELLPETATKAKWRTLSNLTDPAERARTETQLRAAVILGQIEANIMTKLDSAFTVAGVPKSTNQSDALASLRGFAMSKLRSCVVLSAGINQRLFAYAATLDAFFPDENGVFEKRICLKVSDFRSANIQGAMLARKGLWVSEYRIESGLNCGGHAFPTEGQLMGPVLDEFRKNRQSLQQKLQVAFAAALRTLGRPVPFELPPIRISVQGGVGTAAEQQLLRERYSVESVGWGSPFLYCPDVIAIDDNTLSQLLVATRKEVQLSKSSPLGVPFWNLMTSKGEQARHSRNQLGKSGSSCPRGILAFDTEFSDYPICTASRRYHTRLKERLKDAPVELRKQRLEIAEAKSCLCGDLAGSAQLRLGIDPNATPLICPGPNSVYFRRVVSFDEMVGHVYGRNNVLPENSDRPHLFLNEFEIYVDYLENEQRNGPTTNLRLKWIERYKQGLEQGIEHLRELAAEGWIDNRSVFLAHLDCIEARFHSIIGPDKAMQPSPACALSPNKTDDEARMSTHSDPARTAGSSAIVSRLAWSPANSDSSLSIAMTVPEAVSTLVAEPRFRRLIAAFCGPRAEAILHSADGAMTERDFQVTLGRQFLNVLLEKTAKQVEHRVDENIRRQPACLYISNHRDIVLDTALLNDALMTHGKPVPHVAIGDNLLQTEWMVAFFRLCRAFVIHRELSGKQLYEQARQVSEFVRNAIGRGEPVWMAQRPGRTKNGADKTEPGLLRMLLLAYERAPIESKDVLCVTPVAVSYEIEPCDVFKAASLIGATTKNASDNRARRDAANIMRGLVQPKGRICLTIRPPILVDNANGRASKTNRADSIAELAQKVDREITAGYAIWSTNYLAHDLLHGQNEYTDRYTSAERDDFSTYVERRATEILASPSEAKTALLTLYARPVATRPTVSQSGSLKQPIDC